MDDERGFSPVHQEGANKHQTESIREIALCRVLSPLNIFKYEDEKIVLDKYTLIEKNRTRSFYNWIQYFSKESLFNIFEKNVFQIESYFDNLAGLPYTDDALEIAVVARKR